MQPTPVALNAIRFGLFEADLSARELRKRGRKIPLQDQPFRVLTLLLLRSGELVSREEFQKALWPGDTFVEFDEGLNKAIQKLRQALDDSSDKPRFIETLPRRGYRFIAPVDRTASEANTALAQATPMDSYPASLPAVGRPVKRRSMELIAWVLLGVVSVAVVVLAGVYFWVLSPASRSMLKIVPLTSYPGRQITPALSPDGKQVAFAWDGELGGNFDIYVKLVDAGVPLRLTNSPTNEFAPAWSPDGRYIAFCRAFSSADHVEIWMIPALGGAERKLGELASANSDKFCGGLSWSPDGTYLVFRDKNASREPYSIFSLSVDTGAKRKLTSPPSEYLGDWSPRFSPDGKSIAFARHYSFRGELYVLPVTSDGAPRSEPKRLTRDEREIVDLDWTADGRRIVYSTGQDGRTSLFAIPSSGGATERLPVPSENPTALSVSRTGSRLVYERLLVDSNIWRIPGPNSSDREGAPSRFIASTEIDREPQFSPDGTKIVFGSARSGHYEIWVCDREGRNPVQLTFFSGSDIGSPRWSPDSRWIAFDGAKAGNWDIYVISADGGQPRRLTTGASNHVRPSWSKDGRWIYFSANPAGDQQVWKAPWQGGAAVRVTKGGGVDAFEAADGKLLYYDRSGSAGIWKTPVAGGEEIPVLDRGGPNVWALTGQGICFFDRGGFTGLALKFYNFATGKVTLLREFSKDTRINWDDTSLTVSPDGLWILYTQFDQSGSTLMLVENFR